jgi:hypothetical protein
MLHGIQIKCDFNHAIAGLILQLQLMVGKTQAQHPEPQGAKNKIGYFAFLLFHV